jgi:signal transduction histidine kinase
MVVWDHPSDQRMSREIQTIKELQRLLELEAALERVRARSLVMRHTSELQSVIHTVHQELLKLNLSVSGGSFIVINSELDTQIHCWGSGGTADTSDEVTIPRLEKPIYTNLLEGIKKGPGFFTEAYTREEKIGFFNFLFRHKPWSELSAAEKEETLSAPGGYTRSCVVSEHTSIVIVNHFGQAFTTAENHILKRFGAVFEQSYTRFLDLQKAEAQAREAEIEAALERVRSRTMAMHNTEDIGATVAAFFRELVGLGLDASIRCGVGILSQSEHMQLWTASARDASAPVLHSGTLDMSLHPLLQGVKQAWSKGDPSFSYTLEGKDLEHYYQVLSEAPDYAVHFDLKAIPRTVYQNTFIFRDGVLYSFTESPLPENIRNILKRFAAVFGQTYTRYLDLRKAGERAREAQIELGLERVRARAMAMQDSSELTEVLSVIFQQLKLLGVDTVWTHLTLVHLEENAFTYRMTGRNGERIVAEEKISLDASEHWAHIAEAIKSPDKDPDPITRFEVPPEGLDAIWELFDGIFSKLPEGEKVSPADFPTGLYTTQAYCKFGFLGLNQTREATAEEADILLRFTTEFARLYQRFLDLQNAEERAREARIEAALERVRARSMGMHSTEEILEVVVVLFNQLKALDVNFIQAWISIWHLDEGYLEMWMSPIEGFGDQPIYHQRPSAEFEDTTVKSWLKGDRFSYLSLPGEEIVTGFLVRMDQMLGGDYFERLQAKKRYSQLEFVDANHRYGTVSMSWHEEVTEQDRETLYRFSKVFEQTYTRFLDLKKAEEQAREAQIEAALERVRAKTMAMHNTDDIADTVVTFFEELVGLGLDDTMRVGIGILSQSEEMRYWTASVRGTAETILQRGWLDMTQHPLLAGAKRAWSEQVPLFTYTLEGKAVKDYFKVLNDDPGGPLEFDLDALPETIHHKSHVFGDGLLYTFTETPLPQDITSILERFAAVFGQTYTRYLDLERAEKQARESQIEAALERVRAKALAMHSSADLRQTITTIFEELKNLNVKPLRLGLGLLNPDKPEGEIVTSRIGEKDEIIEVSGAFELVGDPILEEVYDHFKKQLDYFPILEGDEITSYYAALTRSVDVEGYGTDTKHYGCFLFFPEGGLYAWAAEPHSEAQIEILKKFSRVVEITYRRYNDLIESEAREKEAVKQASLDRVRAEIASMRTTEDLERITPLVWKELTTLGIPFFRCGVFIMDETSQLVHVYLTNPSGEALAAMDLPFDFDMSLIQKGVAHWRKQEPLIEAWDRKQFIEMTTKLMEHGQVKNIQTYQAGEKPPERLVLHQVPFAQGMLYVGSTQALSEVEMDIVKALTQTFAVAYARYEDFRELEKAKQKVEKTLDELKATQAQLIQSEKMASLGELTAGIAHEIQNPLNFVNNFSEVSRELLEEMTEEIGKSDWEEVKAIAGDVIQNLEKINHHGKRADSIVKGMLQHSRSSEGKKEPTDLNALADEYLRLAYHGLRARNKSFSAEFKTDFDPALPRIDAVPQDMGRVLLNLINNAFQAVENGTRPTVLVATRQLTNAVEISVTDNGPGIPEAIKDKIFQPFFTTKPTGQGTGLGLSLSYDIVKAHGGELSVQSSPESGTTFSIHLGL